MFISTPNAQRSGMEKLYIRFGKRLYAGSWIECGLSLRSGLPSMCVIVTGLYFTSSRAHYIEWFARHVAQSQWLFHPVYPFTVAYNLPSHITVTVA